MEENEGETGFEGNIRIFKHTKPKMPGRYQVEIVKWQVDMILEFK